MTGLLIDYGGVLTTSVFASFASFGESLGIPGGEFLAAIADIGRTEDLFDDIETGRIALEEFERRLAPALSKRLGKVIRSDGLEKGMFKGVVDDEDMLDMVLSARLAGVRTALVSNSWGRNVYPRRRFKDMFDVVLISGEIGLRKPEPHIYLEAASMVGVEPDRCVFVDDMPVNIVGAQAVGMRTLLHQDPAETIPALERLLAVPLGRSGSARNGDVASGAVRGSDS